MKRKPLRKMTLRQVIAEAEDAVCTLELYRRYHPDSPKLMLFDVERMEKSAAELRGRLERSLKMRDAKWQAEMARIGRRRCST